MPGDKNNTKTLKEKKKKKSIGDKKYNLNYNYG